MAVAPAKTEVAQSAAAPSPFTPIADYVLAERLEELTG